MVIAAAVVFVLLHDRVRSSRDTVRLLNDSTLLADLIDAVILLCVNLHTDRELTWLVYCIYLY